MSDGVWFTDSDERSQRVIINFAKMDPADGPALLKAIREAAAKWAGCVHGEPSYTMLRWAHETRSAPAMAGRSRVADDVGSGRARDASRIDDAGTAHRDDLGDRPARDDPSSGDRGER